MKKLLVVLLLLVVGAAVYRRLSAPRAPGAAAPAVRAHLHGTPDHWPPVVRKPGAKRASAA
ncbi:MAG TPA: hypothetical protein VMD28_00710 [Acidimicrobiales bacterium]|nr:hypothetical protein [Acidimicrobiales bacterium]